MDYVPLADDLSNPLAGIRGLLRYLWSVAVLLGIFILAASGWRFIVHEEGDDVEAFIPSGGIETVLVKPGPPIPALQVPFEKLAMGPARLFLYPGVMFKQLTTGANSEEAWLYGAKVVDRTAGGRTPRVAVPTALAQDVVRGRLLSWVCSETEFRDKIKTADVLLGHYQGLVKRGVAAVVRRDGSSVSAYLYYQPSLSEVQLLPTLLPATANYSLSLPPGQRKLTGYEWFRAIGSPRFWVAPMVDASELAFRVLAKQHGAHAAYTPMIHAKIFSQAAKYRRDSLQSDATQEGSQQGFPLLVQFCANDPAILLEAARYVEVHMPHVDGIDINFGCPQRIAKKGRYGAFLQEDPDLSCLLVSTLAKGLARLPVTVKIRLLEDDDEQWSHTVQYAKRLEGAGASLLAVHGRTRTQKRINMPASWAAIRSVKHALQIPVLGNGNIRVFGDVQDMLQQTQVDGVLCADTLLWNPQLYRGHVPQPDPGVVARQYLSIAAAYQTKLDMAKGHLFELLREEFKDTTYLPLRIRLGHANNMEKLHSVVEDYMQMRDTRVANGELAANREYPMKPPQFGPHGPPEEEEDETDTRRSSAEERKARRTLQTGAICHCSQLEQTYRAYLSPDRS